MCSFRTSLIAIILAAFVAKQLHDSGELHELEAVQGSCELVHDDKHGFEDFAVLSDGGFLALDADHSHFQFTLGKSMRDLVKEKLASEAPQPQTLFIVAADGSSTSLEMEDVPREFFAHGLAVFGSVSSKEGATLLVVNHRSDADTLDLFSVKNDRAKFVRSIKHPLLFNVNDCAFFSKDEVYCTNWRSNPTGTLMDAVEVYLRMPWNNVVRCTMKETVECEEVAAKIQMANGIEVSKDRKQVLVVSSTGKALRVYDRDAKDGSLTLNREVLTQSSCDNIGWNGDKVLLACHPKSCKCVHMLSKDVSATLLETRNDDSCVLLHSFVRILRQGSSEENCSL